MATVAELWSAHGHAAFPARLRSADVSGIDMVTLDADVAGCVSVWLRNGGNIDDRRWEILAARERELTRVLPALTGEEAAYCQRLRDMAVVLMDSPGGSAVRSSRPVSRGGRGGRRGWGGG
ncbi:hypothetical protein [Actinoplanes sp. NPDC049118]|uniref:hypothetical protein n=1 Tax=Actinoplanes sp. NPDC049118 TaxID=3155769 RepID=UPI0033EC5B6C